MPQMAQYQQMPLPQMPMSQIPEMAQVPPFNQVQQTNRMPGVTPPMGVPLWWYGTPGKVTGYSVSPTVVASPASTPTGPTVVDTEEVRPQTQHNMVHHMSTTVATPSSTNSHHENGGDGTSEPPQKLSRHNDYQYHPRMSLSEPASKIETKPSPLDAEYIQEKFGFNLSSGDWKSISFIPHQTDPSSWSSPKVSRPKKKDVSGIQHLPTIRYLLDINAFTLADDDFSITQAQEEELLRIYFRSFNALFPVVHEDIFWTLYSQSKAYTLVKYGMVLIAVRDRSARSLLSTIWSGDFDTRLDAFVILLERKIRQIVAVLPELGDDDRLQRLMVSVLLHANFKPVRYGNEQSSQDLHSAIGLAQSIFIHNDSTHKKLIDSGKNDMASYFRHIWWTLYVFDRFNGVVNSKAFMIKQEDFNVLEADPGPLREVCNTCKTLEKVILSVYQPRFETKVELSSWNSEIEAELDGLRIIDLGGFGQIELQAHILKIYALSLSLTIIESFHLTVTKKAFEFSKRYLQIVRWALKFLQQLPSDVIIPISVIPAVTSLFLAILIKYKIKVIYLVILKKVESRQDLTPTTISTIEQLLVEVYQQMQSRFTQWWFVREILESTRRVVKTVSEVPADETTSSEDIPNDIKVTNQTPEERQNLHLNKEEMLYSNSSIMVAPIATIGSSSFFDVAAEIPVGLLARGKDNSKSKTPSTLGPGTPTVDRLEPAKTNNPLVQEVTEERPISTNDMFNEIEDSKMGDNFQIGNTM
ncbi:hypothetical protein PSN45_003578 [Yamadazyma tenuis]|uniref:uncharacterized protein n=1 Tax=Candida tenuis TaxID=2315449 RepID=UPI00279C60CA|nr:hypothetical protein PSN45_003578 [Yamadazyma tenuis]